MSREPTASHLLKELIINSKHKTSIDLYSRRPHEPLQSITGKRKLNLIAPFLAKPIKDSGYVEIFSRIDERIWVDLNVLSDASAQKKDQNIQRLVDWSKAWNIRLDLNMAIFERYRSNTIDPVQHILKNVRSLKEVYGYSIDEGEITALCAQISIRAASTGDFELLRDAVILMRHIFHKDMSLTQKCRLLADHMIYMTVPSTTIFLIATLFFYIKEHPKDFPDLHEKLVNTDLVVKGSPQDDSKSAYNIASDIGLFTYASWPQIGFDKGAFPIIWVATYDKVLSLILQQICFYKVDIENGVNLPAPAYRVGSLARKNLQHIVLPILDEFERMDHGDKAKRSISGRFISELILEGDYHL